MKQILENRGKNQKNLVLNFQQYSPNSYRLRETLQIRINSKQIENYRAYKKPQNKPKRSAHAQKLLTWTFHLVRSLNHPIF